MASRIEAGQFIPTSSTPPSVAGFYRIDRNTIGLVGNLVQKDADTNAESNVVSGANLAAELAALGVMNENNHNPGFPTLYKTIATPGIFGGTTAACTRAGLNGHKMTVTAGQTVSGMTFTFPLASTFAGGDVSFLIYIADFGGNTSFQTVDFYLGDDASFTNAKFKSIGVLNPGWHWITISATANSSGWLWTNSAGSPVFGTTSFTRLRVRTQQTSPHTPVLEFYGMFEGVKTTLPQVVFSFDDGTVEQYNNGLPLMDKYNIPATWFLIPSVFGANGMVTDVMASDAVARGHEICPHGPVGNGLDLNITYGGTANPYAAARADIEANILGLTSRNLCRNGSEKMYAWPGGAFVFGGTGSADTTLMQAAIDAGIVCARNASPGMGNLTAATVGTKYDIMKLPIIGHTAVGDDSATLAATIARLQYCGAKGKHAIIMLHKVTETQNTTHITKANLELLLQAAALEISSGRMIAGTMTSLYKSIQSLV